MAYSVKVIVYTADDSNVIQLVRTAIEKDGARIREFTASLAADGGKELYIELHLSDPKILGKIVRRVEAVPGAAVMASTEPADNRTSKKAKA